jgi:hypothetical protein
VDAGGSTPLHLAALTGHLGVCQLLLRYGARINSENAQGDTPVLVAQVTCGDGVCAVRVSWGEEEAEKREIRRDDIRQMIGKQSLEKGHLYDSRRLTAIGPHVYTGSRTRQSRGISLRLPNERNLRGGRLTRARRARGQQCGGGEGGGCLRFRYSVPTPYLEYRGGGADVKEVGRRGPRESNPGAAAPSVPAPLVLRTHQ